MANSTENKNPNYDRGIKPAEVGARQDREGENFKKKPENEGDIDTTGGMTIDREGKMNNYAIEPEMYINEPGDLREEQEAEKARRAQELKEVKEQGEKGPGVI
jgi:hypothetical protein